MKIHNLPKITKTRRKRLGQGHGSGKGKTAGRGTKGQGARGKVSFTFSAGALSFVKRLPLLRGKYRNKSYKSKPLIVNVKYLNVLPSNTIVNRDSLIKFHIIDEKDSSGANIKILGDGDLQVPLIVSVACSKNAAEKITKAGGKVESK